MKLVIDILQGMGLASAAGLRPFLPTLVAGGFASADIGVDYDGTAFAFLESPIFLLAVWWPGLVAGLLLAALAGAAVRDLFGRVRGRLDREAAAALPIYGEAVAVLLAALAILVPPVSLLAVGFFVWLLLGGRRREGEKYAGLRILR